jgi:hypothetical protein
MQPGNAPRSRLVRAALAGTALLLSVGCGANFDAQTNELYQPAAGINHRSGDVFAFNVLLVFDQGRGTLIGVLLNQLSRPDALTGVAIRSGKTPLKTRIAGSQLKLPSDTVVQLGDKAAVSVRGEDVLPGSLVEVRLSFHNAAPITLNVPVEPRTGIYRSVPKPS